MVDWQTNSIVEFVCGVTLYSLFIMWPGIQYSQCSPEQRWTCTLFSIHSVGTKVDILYLCCSSKGEYIHCVGEGSIYTVLIVWEKGQYIQY